MRQKAINTKNKKDIRGRKAVFLDRDGTINVDKGFVYRIEDFEFLPGAVEGLKLLQDAGYLLVIITNQSGIARGYYTEADFHKLNDWMLAELRTYGVEIDSVYYCPHLPSTDELVVPELKEYRVSCTCRKPQIGLFEKAVVDFNIDLSQSFAIGDKYRDCAICSKETMCKGFLINNTSEIETVEGDITIVSSLLEAARLIVKQN